MKSRSCQSYLWHLVLQSSFLSWLNYSVIVPERKANWIGMVLYTYPLERGIKMECYVVFRCLSFIKLANSAMLDVEITKD